MAFCSQCGAKINDTVKFCPECGAKVIDETVHKSEDKQQGDEYSPAINQTDSNQKSNGKRGLFVAIGAFLALAVLLGIFLLNRFNNEKKTSKENNTSVEQVESNDSQKVSVVEGSSSKTDENKIEYEKLYGTWERVESIEALQGAAGEDITLYLDFKLIFKFDKDNKGAAELKASDSEETLKKKVNDISKDIYINVLKEEGVKNYYTYVTPTGVTYEQGVKMAYDTMYPLMKEAYLDLQKEEINDIFKYEILDNVIYCNGSPLGEYYIINDCLYIKGGDMAELIEEIFGVKREDYVPFNKVK